MSDNNEIKDLKRKVTKMEEQMVELRKNLKEWIRNLDQQKNDFFKIEEIESFYTYPPERTFRSVQKQICCLKKYFPSLSDKIEVPGILPKHAEGWIVVPKFLKIASGYNEALEKILDILKKERPNLLNGREGELGEIYLRINNRTAEALEILEETASGDYLLIAAQLGERHLGRSSRRAQVLFKENEFGLGPLEIGTFLITHPGWLSTDQDLGIDCIGGEYGPYKHTRFKNFLCFYFLKERLHFNDRWWGCPDKKFGPATGFLPDDAVRKRVDLPF